MHNANATNHASHTNSLAMGQNVQQKVREGDWVVLATDGLYDNVSDAEIVSMVSRAEDAMTLAETLGNLASSRSIDLKFRSPFMIAAEKAGVKWQGGKADDITVVTMQVQDDESLSPPALLSTLPEVEAVQVE